MPPPRGARAPPRRPACRSAPRAASVTSSGRRRDRAEPDPRRGALAAAVEGQADAGADHRDIHLGARDEAQIGVAGCGRALRQEHRGRRSRPGRARSCRGRCRCPRPASRAAPGPRTLTIAPAAIIAGTLSAAGEALHMLPTMVARPWIWVEPISSTASTTPGHSALTSACSPSSAPETAAPIRKPPPSAVIPCISGSPSRPPRVRARSCRRAAAPEDPCRRPGSAPGLVARSRAGSPPHRESLGPHNASCDCFRSGVRRSRRTRGGKLARQQPASQEACRPRRPTGVGRRAGLYGRRARKEGFGPFGPKRIHQGDPGERAAVQNRLAQLRGMLTMHESGNPDCEADHI